MATSLFVFIGGGLGALTRHLTSRSLPEAIHMVSISNYLSFASNITGTLLLGLIMALADNSRITQNATFFLATGFCGGLTTFSTFIYEIVALNQKQLSYESIIYLVLSIVLGVTFYLMAYSFTSKLLN